MIAPAIERWRYWCRRFSAALRYWGGDDEYQRYRERCARLRVAPVDRGRYFAQRLEEKYGGVARCC